MDAACCLANKQLPFQGRDEVVHILKQRKFPGVSQSVEKLWPTALKSSEFSHSHVISNAN
jgi:hypothetical protein